MAHAMRAHARQRWTTHEAPGGLAIAVIDHEDDAIDPERHEPALSANRRFWLWMSGEAYDGGALCDVPSAAFSRTLAFRQRLLDAVVARGLDAVASLDGRYQIVLFDAVDGTVTVAVDRFGGLPLYWATSSAGTAFAGGGRGVLMAPGVERDPDADAIREAVTFGGFRLGTRTNVRGVQRLRGGSLLAIDDRVTTRDYWTWPAPASDVRERSTPDLIAEPVHCESLHLQPGLFDVHLSGYIGDAICGTTYDGVVDAQTLLAKLPYSGVSIAWTWEQAIDWARVTIAALSPSAAKFAIYEH